MKTNSLKILLIQILLFLVLPVLLIVFRLVPLNLRGLLLILVVLSTITITFFEESKLRDLGIRIDNLKVATIPYAVFTLLGVLAILSLSAIFKKYPIPNWWIYTHLQWAFLPISASQEFVYRAFFQTRLQKVASPFSAILITSLLYSGMHIIWKNPLILSLTFGAGLSWGYLWYKFPNLWLIIISHSILNFLIIYFGFFPWLVTDFFE